MDLEKIRLGRQEANRLQLWKAESWTPLLFYIHAKACSIGLAMGFAMGILVSVSFYMLFGG